MKSLNRLVLGLLIILNLYPCSAQSQLLSTKLGKNCRVEMKSSSIKNNLFDVTFYITWVSAQLLPVVDTTSVICIDREQLIRNLPKSVRFISPIDTKLISLSSSANLTFEIDEMFPGGNIIIGFPFVYATKGVDPSDPKDLEEFLFKRPRNYSFMIDVPSNIIIHKIPPKITILAPEGIEEGMKPIVDSSTVKILLYAKDAVGVDRVSVNNNPAVQLDDSTFALSITLKVGFENPITVTAFDKRGLSSKKQFAIECRKPEVMIVSAKEIPASRNRIPSDVDTEIPEIATQNPNRFALIIGNEDYSTFQPSLKTESNVDYAIHDAETFKEYALKIIGIPNDNIIMVLNAKTMEMHTALNQIVNIIKNMQGKAELYVYYAGHGFPDEVTKEPYLMPVDVTGTGLQFAIKQSDFFKRITEYPTKRVVVFLDACFSGGGRNQGLLAARGVKIKPKENLLKGNLVVFSASSGVQSSLPYQEKQHGLFTYFLLKKLKDSQGDLNLKDLSDYLTLEVGIRSVMVNNKEQNPQTRVSYDLGDSWKSWTIK